MLLPIHSSNTRVKQKNSPASCAKAIALAEAYGFERHRRIVACPVSFEQVSAPIPSAMEHLLGDG